ncbi:hypothetical protein P7C70_g883, partial [Phenoliferia sp. Uapishka_3]
MRRYADYREEFDATLPTYVSAPYNSQRWRLQWETGVIQVEGHIVPPCIMQVLDLFAMVWGYNPEELFEGLNDAVADGHLGTQIKREYDFAADIAAEFAQYERLAANRQTSTATASPASALTSLALVANPIVPSTSSAALSHNLLATQPPVPNSSLPVASAPGAQTLVPLIDGTSPPTPAPPSSDLARGTSSSSDDDEVSDMSADVSDVDMEAAGGDDVDASGESDEESGDEDQDGREGEGEEEAAVDGTALPPFVIDEATDARHLAIHQSMRVLSPWTGGLGLPFTSEDGLESGCWVQYEEGWITKQQFDAGWEIDVAFVEIEAVPGDERELRGVLVSAGQRRGSAVFGTKETRRVVWFGRPVVLQAGERRWNWGERWVLAGAESEGRAAETRTERGR